MTAAKKRKAKSTRAAPAKRAKLEYAKTISELAAVLGKSRSQIYDYWERGCPRKESKRGYRVDLMRKWIAENLELPTDARNGPNGDDEARLKKAQADEREAKAELARLKVQIERGEWVRRDKIRERDLARIAMVKRGLQSLARRLGLELEGLTAKEMDERLRARFRELCDRFAEM